MTRPLYRDHQAPPELPAHGHRGLWFERFFDRYDDEWDVSDEGKTQWIISNAQRTGDAEALAGAVQRQLALVTALGGRGAVFGAEWHFATGLGLAHPVENGLAWHHTLGVPYLSGSAVKGLVRAWVEVWDESLGEADSDQRRQRLDRWFGTTEQAGLFRFFDALPIEPVQLHADVMTPHMGKWYEKGGEIENWLREPEAVPADWHAPVPVPFLVARKPRLLFAIAPARAEADGELDAVFHALRDALEWLGAGAKTAVGYGHMSEDEERTAQLVEEYEQSIREAQMAELSPERQVLARLTQQLEESIRQNVKPDAGGAFMAEVGQCLGNGLAWPLEERHELADLIERIYSRAGWGSGDKKRKRKEGVERLRC